MSEKQPIVILTHGGWGERLISSIRMITGGVENIHEVALEPADNLTEYIERVKEQIGQLVWSDKLLILTDIKGGTTSNVALRLSREYDVLALSGLSTAMLLEAVMKQDQPFTESAGAEIVEATIANCQILQVPSI